MEPRRGLNDKDLENPRRAKPATVGMMLMLIIGGMIMGTSLALNFFIGEFYVWIFVVGVVLIGIAVAYLVVNAFKDDAGNETSTR
ncbi:hypothetical protein [Enteractinococcus helveticum]|uniref:Uncharacterized protein n=1 Tax=Enteractinococcus helveticum TaxID=1837282 RepID=A0A1B7M396_9MICC|nr:hypothetical protein [Enteractinococcus helveticum]OAV63073.1 hypothetical protein A6F49_03260 [Enteractinococcus helveticum]